MIVLIISYFAVDFGPKVLTLIRHEWERDSRHVDAHSQIWIFVVATKWRVIKECKNKLHLVNWVCVWWVVRGQFVHVWTYSSWKSLFIVHFFGVYVVSVDGESVEWMRVMLVVQINQKLMGSFAEISVKIGHFPEILSATWAVDKSSCMNRGKLYLQPFWWNWWSNEQR